MAIQPIDLQTLFTQVEKVGKEQANQKQGLQLQQSIQGAHMQQKAEERIRSVNESQDTGAGTERVKDRPPRKHREYEGDGEDTDESGLLFADLRDSADSQVIHDPALGKNVDLSG
jgi:hypothetical protein